MRISEDVLTAFKTHAGKATTKMDEVLREFAESAGQAVKVNRGKTGKAVKKASPRVKRKAG
jgi:ElaB/YqjD/DUF883 family membrane-anchored ribosome-binding protein